MTDYYERNKIKKQLIIFLLMAYGVTYLMGILLWYGSAIAVEISVFPGAQMFYPAAGVMLAYLLTKWEDSLLPRWFYLCFLLITLLMMIFSILSVVMPSRITNADGMEMSLWTVFSRYAAAGGSILCWITLLTAGKERRAAYGLGWKCWKTSLLCILLFAVLYFVRAVVSYGISGQTEKLSGILSDSMVWRCVFTMPTAFFINFIAFFGEEYGWRYYLRPILQKRFGMRGGVLILGAVWGIYHIFLDFFYYMPRGLAAVAMQIIACVFVSVFFAWAYMKTGNIWVPVILHFLNNHLSWVMAGRYSQSVLENRQAVWAMVPETLLVNGAVFGFFLLSKEFRKRNC